MTDTREFYFPVDILFGPLGREGLERADTLSIRPMEAGPFLGRGLGGEHQDHGQGTNAKQETLHEDNLVSRSGDWTGSPKQDPISFAGAWNSACCPNPNQTVAAPQSSHL
jgi:hypothetical protein